MKIDISINMPTEVNDNYRYKDLMEKCCDYMSYCESDEDSEYHWRYLKALYKALSKRTQLDTFQLAILEKLEEFITKYDMDRTSLDAKDMFKSYK